MNHWIIVSETQKNIIWVIYRIKQLRNYKKNHGLLRGPQLGKQSWRPRLGILRVKPEKSKWNTQFYFPRQNRHTSSALQKITCQCCLVKNVFITRIIQNRQIHHSVKFTIFNIKQLVCCSQHFWYICLLGLLASVTGGS